MESQAAACAAYMRACHGPAKQAVRNGGGMRRVLGGPGLSRGSGTRADSASKRATAACAEGAGLMTYSWAC